MTEKKEKPQEIDLIELFSRMGNSIANLFSRLFSLLGQVAIWIINASKESLRFGIKNSPLFLFFGIIGWLYGTYNIKTSKPYYKTSATIQTFIINSSSLIEYTNTLNPIALNGDSLALSNILDISVKEASSIKSIEAFWSIDKNKDGVADEIDYNNSFEPDTLKNWDKISDRFIVQLTTYNPEYISNIQNKFERYLNNYPQLEQITEVRKQNLKARIQRIDSELSILDSLKNYEYFLKDKEKQNIGIIPLDKLLLQIKDEKVEPTRLLHEITMNLENENLANKAELELNSEPFIFISKFASVSTKVDINQDTSIVKKSIVFFLYLSFILSLLIKFRKIIIQFIKE